MAAPCIELKFRTRREQPPMLQDPPRPWFLFDRKGISASSIIKDLGKDKKPEPNPFADRHDAVAKLLIPRLLRSRELNSDHIDVNNKEEQLMHAIAFMVDNLTPTNTARLTFGLRNQDITIWMDYNYKRISDSLHTAGDLLFVKLPDGSYRIREYEELILVAVATLRMLGYNAKFAYVNVSSSPIVTDELSQGRAPAVAIIEPFKRWPLITFCISHFHPPINGIEIYSDAIVVSYLYANAARNIFLKLARDLDEGNSKHIFELLDQICSLFIKSLDIYPVAPWSLAFYDELFSLREGEFIDYIKKALGERTTLMASSVLNEGRIHVGRPS